MRQEIRIGTRWIGARHPVFIMAEAGVTCNYDVGITKQLIDVVRESGADAIKLIFWFPDEIMSDRTIDYAYETVEGPRRENMYEMLNALRFSLDQWREIKAYADARGVILFSTVNSPTGIAWAETLKLEAYKLSSWDYNYAPLWRQIAALGKPMLIDTGPVTTRDVANTLELMRQAGNDQCVLVHCTHADRPEEMHLRAIPYMRETFQTLVGYSSKDRDATPDLLAVALGATVLEKRLTMSRSLPGHHHILSMEPKEFAEYVALIRRVEASLGDANLTPSAPDVEERRKWFRHLVAARPLTKGTVLTPELVEGKRPESGISPELLEYFLGKPLTRDLKDNESLGWDHV